MNNNISYKEIIEEKGFYIGTTMGTSMMPMIRQGIDTIKLVKPRDRCKKYDVILFKREDGKYVLHRIVGVKKNSYDLCGDNQYIIEHGITDDMIIGILDGFYREEKYISNDDIKYIKYYKRVVRTRWIRYIKGMSRRAFNKIFKRKKK